MLVRVLEIPPPSGKPHFGGAEPQTFMEVDWFRDDPTPGLFEKPDFATPEGKAAITETIKRKRYYSDGKSFLVLHPEHPFTINYSAP